MTKPKPKAKRAKPPTKAQRQRVMVERLLRQIKEQVATINEHEATITRVTDQAECSGREIVRLVAMLDQFRREVGLLRHELFAQKSANRLGAEVLAEMKKYVDRACAAVPLNPPLVTGAR